MQHDFETPRPITLVLQGRSVDVSVHTHDDPTTRITLTDPQDPEDQAQVTQEGDTVRVVYPTRSRPGFFRRHEHLEAVVELPQGSNLHLAVGSGDVTATGTYGQVLLDGGSGDISLDDCAHLTTRGGSGGLSVRSVRDEADVKQGSGDLTLQHLGGRGTLRSGSGEVQVGRAVDAELDVMTGSGEVTIGEMHGGTGTIKTGSGDVRVREIDAGQLKAMTASGDVGVTVRRGVPVWTEVLTASGDLTSRLRGGGQPADGQPYVALTIRTASGDIDLDES